MFKTLASLLAAILSAAIAFGMLRACIQWYDVSNIPYQERERVMRGAARYSELVREGKLDRDAWEKQE